MEFRAVAGLRAACLSLLAAALVGCASAPERSLAADRSTRAQARSAPAGRPLAWPLRGGRVSSGFGQARSGYRHRGIDIRVAPGTPIRAAAAGRVHFAGRMRGYGNVVIVLHDGGLETRYAHNRRNLVVRGQRVAAGEVLAEVGRTGNATAPHVHFEVREHGRALDPLRFLAGR